MINIFQGKLTILSGEKLNRKLLTKGKHFVQLLAIEITRKAKSKAKVKMKAKSFAFQTHARLSRHRDLNWLNNHPLSKVFELEENVVNFIFFYKSCTQCGNALLYI